MRYRWLLVAIAALWLTVDSAQAFAQKRICVINSDGTGLRTLVDMPGYQWSGSPSWSHDGKKIAFDATTGGFEEDHIFVVDAAGGEPRDLGLGSGPSWSDDDKQICFFTLKNNSAGEKVGIWMMTAEGKSRQFVTAGTKGHWSNDGSKFAYLNKFKGKNTIWVYNILDAEAKPVVKEQFSEISPPVWSADDKQIAFVGMRDDTGITELCIIDADGEPKLTTKLKEQVSLVWPSWSPDKKILFGHGDQFYGRPHVLDLTKNDELTTLDCDVVNFFESCWSPDGKQIAFRCEK